MTQITTIQEVVDLIVDHLVQDILLNQWRPGQYRQPYPISLQLRELKQCALVNKVFASRSQKHLFSTIKIHAERTPEFYLLPETEWTCPQLEPTLEEGSLQTIGRLVDIFHQKPHLTIHLHTMDICSQFGYLLTRYHSLKQLMSFLRSRGNPRNIRFIENGYFEDCRILPDYNFQRSIGATLESLECSFLETIPVWFIANNPLLNSLNLSWCGSGQEVHGGICPHDMSLLSRPRIKSLTLKGSWSMLEILSRGSNTGRSAVDFSSLRFLHLYPTSEDRDVSSVQQIVSIAGSSLGEMIMSTSIQLAASYSRRLNLSSCTNLHKVVLLTAIQNDNSNKFDHLIDTLNSIPCPNIIKVLDIEVYLPITDQEWFQTYTSLRWDAMDAEIHRISNAAAAASQLLICNLRIQFTRNHMVTRVENYNAAVKECEAFTEGLKNGRFPMTTSNERIEFRTSMIFYVDHQY